MIGGRKREQAQMCDLLYIMSIMIQTNVSHCSKHSFTPSLQAYKSLMACCCRCCRGLCLLASHFQLILHALDDAGAVVIVCGGACLESAQELPVTDLLAGPVVVAAHIERVEFFTLRESRVHFRLPGLGDRKMYTGKPIVFSPNSMNTSACPSSPCATWRVGIPYHPTPYLLTTDLYGGILFTLLLTAAGCIMHCCAGNFGGVLSRTGLDRKLTYFEVRSLDTYLLVGGAGAGWGINWYSKLFLLRSYGFWRETGTGRLETKTDTSSPICLLYTCRAQAPLPCMAARVAYTDTFSRAGPVSETFLTYPKSEVALTLTLSITYAVLSNVTMIYIT